MVRPVIGLTTYAVPARFASYDGEISAALPMAYVQAVHRSGGLAVLITPDDPDVAVLDRVDGMIFSGGSDVDSDLYGEPRHETTSPRRDRDDAELVLMRAALMRDLPVLGVCRGFQLLTIVSGGRLHQHLPEVLGHDGHRPGGGLGEHRVRLAPGTTCHKILGDEVTVSSFHHQGVAEPGRLTEAGWSTDDNLLEAGEDPDRAFAVGVQWHPETGTDLRIFEALVQAARG
jgi:putative glutamine amidotransferase